jgi:pimeloyl-ACP methyl ester carboxylesterase
MARLLQKAGAPMSKILLQVLFCGFVLVTTSLGQQPTFKPLDATTYEPYLGSYQLASGKLIVIGRSVRRLYFYEPATGRVRGLTPQSETAAAEVNWSAGPSLAVFSPATLAITFTKNKIGEVAGLVLKEEGQREQAGTKSRLYTEEEVVFRNGDVALGGKLLIPSTKGPHPAAIFLHGSGPQDRNGELSQIRFMADHFARHGIASLIYDKRGFGSSTGNWSTASFSDLAGDAIAGLKLLQSRQDINPKQIGFVGVSQAGWVMTTASSMSNEIAFIISISAGGSGYTPAQQNNYNVATEMRANGFSPEEIAKVIRCNDLLYDLVRASGGSEGAQLDALIRDAIHSNAKLKDWLPPLASEIDWKKRDQWFLALDIDLNPAPLWEKFDGPVFGIFGELDSSTPVQQVVPIFGAALARRKKTDYAIKVFPKANHNILQAATGSDNELPRLTHLVPVFMNTMTDWLRSRVDIMN